MKPLSRTVRLISAIASVAITLALLGAVFAIAEPQRSVLIAKLQPADPPAAPRMVLWPSATRRR